MSKRGLGKGLDALIPGAGAFGARAIQEIDINSIKVNPLQPRTQMDEEGLEDLANSIRVHGVLQPLLVRKAEEGFELIAGEKMESGKTGGLIYGSGDSRRDRGKK